MYLYHVSYTKVQQFQLRVPPHRLDNENGSMLRICCSTSIENCIMSKPGQTKFLDLCLQYKLPCILYIYRFDMNPASHDLMFPEKLEKQYGVKDATLLQEHWIMNHVPPCKETVCKVTEAIRHKKLLEKIHITKNITEADFLFVRVMETLQKQTGKLLQPNEVLPQMWDDVLKSLQENPRKHFVFESN